MKKLLSILAAILLSAGATAAIAQGAPSGQAGDANATETVKERAGSAVEKVKDVAGDVAAATRRGIDAAKKKIKHATSAAKSKSTDAADNAKDHSGDLVTKRSTPDAAADAAATSDATLVRTGPTLRERAGEAKDKAGNAPK